RDQPMTMLVKNASHPLREWKKEHVVAVSRGPIRHGHSHPLARHHSAHANQQKGGARRKHSESVQPLMFTTHRKRRYQPNPPLTSARIVQGGSARCKGIAGSFRYIAAVDLYAMASR